MANMHIVDSWLLVKNEKARLGELQIFPLGFDH